MTTKICDLYPVECSDPACPCHEWSKLANLALKTLQNASSSKGMTQDSRNVKTPSTHPSASRMVISGFDHDWLFAPIARRRRVEQEDALFWYTAGARAKEAEMLELFNGDLRELVRVAREKVRR